MWAAIRQPFCHIVQGRRVSLDGTYGEQSQGQFSPTIAISACRPQRRSGVVVGERRSPVLDSRRERALDSSLGGRGRRDESAVTGVPRKPGTGYAVRVCARFLARERRRERASRALYTGCAQRSALMRGRLSTAPSVSHYKGNHQHPQRVSPTTALDVSNRRHLACEAICLALSVRASYCEIIARPPLDGAHSEHSPAPSARVAHDGARASSWASVAVLYWTRGASAPSTPRWVGEGGVMRAS